MALRTLVKISNITNLSDARYCAGMGVEWLGFSMDSLPLEKFTEIRNWVAGVDIVGETDSLDLGHINELVQRYTPDALQIADVTLLESLYALNIPLFLKADAASLSEEDMATILEEASPFVKGILLENSDPFARLNDESRQLIDRLSTHYPILLSYGLTELNVNEVLDELPMLTGITMNGGDELRPGFKDFGEMMDVLEKLEVD